ncbi:hypothetical protein GALMADRAFT_54109, partial [Galerina marginata CBS 339.88]
RIGDSGEPCGMPFCTMAISPRVPSRHTAAWRSLRKLAIHLTYSRGIPFLRSSDRSRLWFTKSKYPFISNVSADVTFL